MRDVFYTILVVWVIWRILNAVSLVRTKQTASSNTKSSKKEGETTVDFIPPKKKSFADDEGEYVDYEEIK